jgi:hypothetical protein
MFARLRTDRGRDRYPEITCHRAPHKPLLLLFVMDLITRGRIAQNLIEARDNLAPRERHITPNEDQYWPAQENFDYHRSKTLLR